MTRKEIQWAVARIDAIDEGDYEVAHTQVDHILVKLLPQEIQDAHARLVKRCSWWTSA